MEVCSTLKGKLLPHSDLREGGGGGSVSRGKIGKHTKRDEKRELERLECL